jgi:hypothetical protein
MGIIATCLLLVTIFKLRLHVKNIEEGKKQATTVGLVLLKLHFKSHLAFLQALCVFLSIPAILYIGLSDLYNIRCRDFTFAASNVQICSD